MSINQILVATDYTEAADSALAYGRELARQSGGRLHVMHATQDQALKGRQRLTAAAPAGGPEEIPVVVTAASASVIVDYATEHAIDLIVMGTRRRTGLAHLALGSVAERVVRFAPCPVLTVRGPRPQAADTHGAEAVTNILEPA